MRSALPWLITAALSVLLLGVGARWASLEFATRAADEAPIPALAAGARPTPQRVWGVSANPANPSDPAPEIPGALPEVTADWLTNPESPLPPEIMERARRQFAAEVEARRAERRAAARDELDAFIEEEQLEEGKAEALVALFDRMEQTMAALREPPTDGSTDPRERFARMREARESIRAEADALLGEEAADRLRERIREAGGFGPGPMGGMPGMFGPGPAGGGPAGPPGRFP